MMPVVRTRETRETFVKIRVSAESRSTIQSGLPFLDHMLATFASYAGIGLDVEARGDLRHHLIEDVAITLGASIRASLPTPCARYGECTIPMDDALVQVAIDVGDRFYYAGRLPSRLYEHWMRSFSEHLRATVHVRVLRGRDRHHVVEAAFKALGIAVASARKPVEEIRSTKGTISVEGTSC